MPAIILAYSAVVTLAGDTAAGDAEVWLASGAWSAYRRSHITRAAYRGDVVVVGIVCVEGWANEKWR